MSKKTPTIALVGPPNVGKSTLFNTMLGKRIAITGPRPGTTRDRAYGETKWNDKRFILIDTGGLARKSGDPLEKNIRAQTQLAVTEADAIIFVVDAKAPVSAAVNTTKELKEVLRKNKLLNKLPVFVVANKIDSAKYTEKAKADFVRLGLGGIWPISALTGRGVGDLLDKLVEEIEKSEDEEPEEIFANVAIVGKPNAGKSTLVNHLVGEERAIVSPLPGTTRAAVDVKISYKGKILKFIDTAGMRRRSKIDIDVEQYALFQALKSLENSDVVVLMLDAADVRARFEQTIAGKLKSSVKGIVIALNKVDLLEDKKEIERIKESTIRRFPFLRFVKFIPISAEKGWNVKELLEAIVEAKNSRLKEIPEEDLTKDLKAWIKKNPPMKLRAQKKPVIYDLEQVKTNPPVFMLVVNDPAAIHYSYVRHLENKIREKYEYAGTAIKIRLRRPER